MKFDLHIHSCFSYDCISQPADIIRAAKEKGLSGIAITDHNTIAGSVAAKKINNDPDFQVIVGAEIATDQGDIIGLFLEREIESREALAVIKEIKAQGGLAILPHPCRGHRLKEETVPSFDFVEIKNAHNFLNQDEKAEILARKYGKSVVAGSDAHYLSEIGCGVTIIEGTDLRKALEENRVSLVCRNIPHYKVDYGYALSYWRRKMFKMFAKYLWRAFLSFIWRKK